MEKVSYCKIDGILVRLYSLTDEETWPDWLRATLSIAFVIFLFATGLIFLTVTP